MFQNTKSKFRPDLYIIAFFLIFLLNSCSTKEEGCLDIVASNFDFNADRACENCCEYPVLSLLLTQKWNDTIFSDSTLSYDVLGRRYNIIDLKYLLSSFSWTDTDEFIHTIDSVEIDCEAGVIKYTPDLLVIDTRRFSYPLDSVREPLIIRSIKFHIGWPPDLVCVNASLEDIPDVLQDENMLWDSITGTRAAIRLILQRDITMDVFDTLYIQTLMELPLTYNYTFNPGENTNLGVTVNYAKWFEDADITNLNSFRASILDHLKESFSKTP